MADPQQSGGGPIDLRNPQGGGEKAGGTTQTGGSQNTGAPADPFSKFEIPETVKQKYPDLIPLIIETESMNDEERQYWFQILPIMTDEQVNRLREILTNEKKQLAKLDKEYEQELKQINDKHVVEWKAFEAKEKRQKLQAKEGKAQEAEKTTEEDLLKKLQGL